MKVLSIFLLATFLSSIAVSGDKIQNGGNVIVCPNGIELLDYYEARLSGKALQLDSSSPTYAEKLFTLFEKWKSVAPRRMALYTKWLKEFTAEAGIYSGVEIPAIPDTGSIVIPSGCKPIPAAFQRREGDIFPGEKRYVVNKDLWDLMDENQKAGLVLHELIYREAIKSQHATSLPTRYFNSFLSTEENPKADKYFSVVAKMPLAWAEFGGGLVVDLASSRINEDRYRLSVSEVIGDVKTKNLSIEFHDLVPYPHSCRTTNGLSVELSTESFYLGELCYPIKRILVQGKFSFSIPAPTKISSIHYSGRMSLSFYNGESGKFLLDPIESWHISPSGKKLSNLISHDYRDYSTYTTEDLREWSYKSNSNSLSEYVEKFYSFSFLSTEIKCTHVATDHPSEYRCPDLPEKVKCFVEVHNSKGEYVGREATQIEILQKKIFDDKVDSNSDNSYMINLPKNQIIGYRKKITGKLEAERTSEAGWKKLRSYDDSCYFEN